MGQGTPAHQQSRNAFSLSLSDPGDGAPLCTSVARTRPVHLSPAQGGRSPTSFPLRRRGGVAHPHQLHEKGSAFTGCRCRGTAPQRQLAGERKQWWRGEVKAVPAPAFSSSLLPRCLQGRGVRLREGPSLATPLEARCCALLPKAPPRPTACDRLARVGRCPPLSLCPSSPQLPCPHMGPVGGEKRAPAPTEGGRSSFETARSAF